MTGEDEPNQDKHIWKCYNETPCAVRYTNKNVFKKY
jgi:hypothetical protein